MRAPQIFSSDWYEGMGALARREWSEADAREVLAGKGGDAVEAVWEKISTADFAGAAVPEALGGSELELGAVIEVGAAAGAALLPPRLAFEALLPGLVLRGLPRQGRAEELLRGLAAGERLAVATGRRGEAGDAVEFVHGVEAGRPLLLLDPAGPRIALLGGEEVRDAVALHVLDGRGIGNAVLAGEGAEIAAGAAAAGWAERALWTGALLAAADALGAASAAIDRAIDYAGERRQFGSPIGSFQAVKHALVDRFLDLQVGRALLAAATESEELDPVAAAMAKAHVNEAAVRCVNTAIQVHGAIGFTDELGLHLYQRRVLVDRELFAGTGTALAVVRGALGLGHAADPSPESTTVGALQ